MAALVAACLLWWSLVTSVLAQDGAPGTLAVDIVRLASGAEYKGQIAERVPDSHVVIVTLTGEVKRFEWTEVAFAGPAAAGVASAPASDAVVPEAVTSVPPAVPTAQAAPAGGVLLQLQANREGILWLAHRQADPLSRTLCMGPCQAKLEPGVYRLGLSTGSRDAVWHEGAFDIKQDSAWSGTYKSRRGSRIGGGVILGGGLLAAIPLIIAGANQQKVCDSVMDLGESCEDAGVSGVGKGMMAAGLIVGVASAVIGIALMSRKDQATIRPNDGAGIATEDPSTPAAVTRAEYESTVWSCVDDTDAKSVRLTVEVNASGDIAKVTEVEDVGWSARTCIRNNVLGLHIGGVRGSRAVTLRR